MQTELFLKVKWEFCHLLITWLLEQPAIQRVWAVSDLQNYSSIKILEKLSFQNEGILRKWLVLPVFNNQSRDCYVFSKISAVSE